MLKTFKFIVQIDDFSGKTLLTFRTQVSIVLCIKFICIAHNKHSNNSIKTGSQIYLNTSTKIK